jgi:serine/threonine protein kinase
VTLWYRPPEIFLGDRHYTSAVDIWASGCVFAKMVLRRPLFRGSSELDQMDRIVRLLGLPTEHDWPGVSRLPHASRLLFPREPVHTTLADMLHVLPCAGIGLLRAMLALCPGRRPSARAALAHPFLA